MMARGATLDVMIEYDVVKSSVYAISHEMLNLICDPTDPKL